MCSTGLIEKMIEIIKDELAESGIHSVLRDIEKGYIEASTELDKLAHTHRGNIDKFDKLGIDHGCNTIPNEAHR